MRAHVTLLLTAMAAAAACSRQADKVPPSADPQFEARWQQITAADGVEVLAVGADQGEALMGSVRRTTRRPSERPDERPALRASIDGSDVQDVIRSNLTAVRGCYQSVTRRGPARSGKAIVTFAIGADGRPSDVRVEAPSFQGTSLPGCLTSQIGFWAFPKSQKGGGVVSYPFVFMGV